MHKTDDLRIAEIQEVMPPEQLIKALPMNAEAAACIYDSRAAIKSVLRGVSEKLIVVVGPCSIHDLDAAREFAGRLLPRIEKCKDQLHIVMRVYFEKPRTIAGWKGLINDPELDGSFAINDGLKLARKLLLDLNNMGVSAGTEYLDLVSPQYYADLISWGAIGARTTESQAHRELASGLSCPVGFKNGTDGNLKIAVDALRSAAHPHHFLSVTKKGKSAIFSTVGNDCCHVILRGGMKSNFDPQSVAACADMLSQAGQRPNMMIDFSHANSDKKHERQLLVGKSVAAQIRGGETRVIGVMIEGNLVAGRQDYVSREKLVYGQSITDACLGWEDTESLLELLREAVIAGRG